MPQPDLPPALNRAWRRAKSEKRSLWTIPW